MQPLSLSPPWVSVKIHQIVLSSRMIFTFWIRPLALKLKMVSATNSWLHSFTFGQIFVTITPQYSELCLAPCLRTYVWICQIFALFSYQSKIYLPTLIRHFWHFLVVFSAQNWASETFYCVCQRDVYRVTASFQKQICQNKLFLKLHQYWRVRKTSFFLKSTTNSICSIATQFYEFFSPSGHFSNSLLFCHQGIWVLTT